MGKKVESVLVRHEGRLYLVRCGHVFVKASYGWSSGNVEPSVAAVVLATAKAGA